MGEAASAVAAVSAVSSPLYAHTSDETRTTTATRPPATTTGMRLKKDRYSVSHLCVDFRMWKFLSVRSGVNKQTYTQCGV